MTAGGTALETEGSLLARRELGEGLGAEPTDRLAADPRRRDDARLTQLADVPADEWLRQPDVVHQLGDARLAAGETLHDPQTIHVGERLVERTQCPQLIGLVDDPRDGRADSGGGGGQG